MTKILSSVHNHTTFCDGLNTPEEMVLAAMDKGLLTLGFSGHSYVPQEGFGIAPEKLGCYKAEILRLKEKYRDRIDILLGMEIDDMAPPTDVSALDYVIGSIHFAKDENGRPWVVDDDSEKTRKAVSEGFGGDPLAFVGAYYDGLTRFITQTRPPIVGHFDMPRKYNRGNAIFDENGADYQKIALAALDALLPLGCVFEVNTSIVRRGLSENPYPDVFLLRRILAYGGSVMITADAHRTDDVDSLFEETAQRLRKIGFRSVKTLTAKGFEDIIL